MKKIKLEDINAIIFIISGFLSLIYLIYKIVCWAMR